jgi:predicted flavoprotein YhiN
MLNIRKELFESNEVLNLLTGMLPKMLGQVILKKASIDMNSYIKNLTKANITKIAGLIKAFPLDVKGDYGFERSQVTVGGVSLTEVDNETLEIRKMPNAYVCGEIIDVDGECGGYNMQWALASGYLVGKKISESINENA